MATPKKIIKSIICLELNTKDLLLFELIILIDLLKIWTKLKGLKVDSLLEESCLQKGFMKTPHLG